MMSLFAAAAGTYYPQPENALTTSWGATAAVNDWVFGDGAGGSDGSHAVIRAILLPNSASTPTVSLRDGTGTEVMRWTLGTHTQNIMFGPDGVKLPDGFYITTTGTNSYVIVVYDRA